MRSIITALLGIATLIGSASITATEAANATITAADEECYEHIVSDIRVVDNEHTRITIRDAYGNGPFDAKYRVYNQHGNPLTITTGYVSDITVPLYGSKLLMRNNIIGVRVREDSGDRYRHVHIFTDADAVVQVTALFLNGGMYNIPVVKRELTDTTDWEAPCNTADNQS